MKSQQRKRILPAVLAEAIEVGDHLREDVTGRVLRILPVAEAVEAEAEDGVEVAMVERLKRAAIVLGVGNKDRIGKVVSRRGL